MKQKTCGRPGNSPEIQAKHCGKIVTRFMCVCANSKLNDNNTISSRLRASPFPLPPCAAATPLSESYCRLSVQTSVETLRCLGGVAWKYFKCDVSAQFSTVCRVNPHAFSLSDSLSLSHSRTYSHLMATGCGRRQRKAKPNGALHTPRKQLTRGQLRQAERQAGVGREADGGASG